MCGCCQKFNNSHLFRFVIIYPKNPQKEKDNVSVETREQPSTLLLASVKTASPCYARPPRQC